MMVPLRTKIFLLSICFSVGLLLLFIAPFYYVSKNNIYTIVHNSLQATAELRSTQVKKQLDTYTTRAIDFSSDGYIKQQLTRIASATNNTDRAYESTLLTNHLQENKIVVDDDFYAVYILDRNNEVVAFTTRYDKHISDPSKIFDGPLQPESHNVHSQGIYPDIVTGEPVLHIYAPVYLDEQGIGMVVNTVSAQKVFSLLTDRRSLNSTWESYIVSNSLQMTSPSRFVANSVFVQDVDTTAARACFKTGSTPTTQELLVSEDYRGVSVLSAYRYLPEIDSCLLVEVDALAAYADIREMTQFGFILIPISLLFIIMISAYFRHIVLAPIYYVTDAVKAIHAGDYTVQIPVERDDEAGALAKAFNTLVDIIQNMDKTMKNEIKEKTKEIRLQKEAADEALKEATFLNESMLDRELRMIALKEELRMQKGKKKNSKKK